MGLHVGVDFGTSTISAAVWHSQSDTVRVLSSIMKTDGPVPNAIFYTPQQRHLGIQAQKRSLMSPQHFISNIKRELSGTGWRRSIFDEEKTAVDVMVDIFQILKGNIERNYGDEPIESVVITVPFAFLYNERQKILEAARRADLPVIRLIEEPVAAALAAGIFDNNVVQTGDYLLVFDFGGGTLDMTIFQKQLTHNGQIAIEVFTTDGYADLGGKDIDQLIVKKLLSMMDIDLSTLGVDPKVDKFKLKLQDLAENIKKTFTIQDEVHEFFVDEWGGAHDLKINYETFQQWLENSILYKINQILDDMLEEIHFVPANIQHVILVGGSSYLRPVEQKLRRYFQRTPIKNEDLTTLVAKGAGIYCGMLQKGEAKIRVKQKVSHHIGVNISGKMQPILFRNTAYGIFSQRMCVPSNKIAIYQGNSTMLQQCRKIGFYDVSEQVLNVEQLYIQIGSNEEGLLIVQIYDGDLMIIEQPMIVN